MHVMDANFFLSSVINNFLLKIVLLSYYFEFSLPVFLDYFLNFRQISASFFC